MKKLRWWLARKLIGPQLVALTTDQVVVCEADISHKLLQWVIWDDGMWEGPTVFGSMEVVEKSAYDKLKLINTRLRATIAINDIEKNAGW